MTTQRKTGTISPTEHNRLLDLLAGRVEMTTAKIDRRWKALASILVLMETLYSAPVIAQTEAQPAIAAEEPPSQPEPTLGEGQVSGEPTMDAGCTQRAIPRAYWQKAMEWLDSGHPAEGRLLLRDLSRDFPDSQHGRMAADWLLENKDVDRSGRAEFIGASTLAAYGLTFSLVGGMLGQGSEMGVDDWKIALWTSLGGAGVGLLGSALWSKKHSVSDSQALLLGYAAYWGWLNGYMLYDLVAPLQWEDALLAGAGGMALGVGTIFTFWKAVDVPEGAAQMTLSLSSFSLELLVLANLGVGGVDTFKDNETVALLTLLVPANVAAVGGYFLGRKLGWSAGDIRLIGLGGILGNLLGFTLWATVETDDFENAMWIMEGSVLAGLALGTFIVAPWKRGGEDDGSKAVASNALVHIGPDGTTFQAPMPLVTPFRHKGESAVAFEVPLLSMDW